MDNPTTLNASQRMFHTNVHRRNQPVEKFIQAGQCLTFRLFLGLESENTDGSIALEAGVFVQGGGGGVGNVLLVSHFLIVGLLGLVGLR